MQRKLHLNRCMNIMYRLSQLNILKRFLFEYFIFLCIVLSAFYPISLRYLFNVTLTTRIFGLNGELCAYRHHHKGWTDSLSYFHPSVIRKEKDSSISLLSLCRKSGMKKYIQTTTRIRHVFFLS